MAALEGQVEDEPATQPAQGAGPDTSEEIPNGRLAHLTSLLNPGEQYDFLESTKEFIIGRKSSCQIVVKDPRCSGKHLRIYRDSTRCFFVEQLGSNGSFINENRLLQGETRLLCHGDDLSLVNYARSKSSDDPVHRPFAAFIFRCSAEKDVDFKSEGRPSRKRPCPEPGRSDSPTALPPEASLAATIGAGGPSSESCSEVALTVKDQDVRHLRTDREVQDTWDMRTEIGRGNFSEVRLGVQVCDGAKRAIKIVDRHAFQLPVQEGQQAFDGGRG
eukprot:TRINITY_DN73315_c0_g1_i1.p1 TRINITY_DN73315_c0_g1~~TRINITY_DN73315_c0_g1_i1.p1  ORF type:complete len:274 (+),score=41.16 TRINITY_DN73315_c0_g1_i1:113-934(+)